MHCHSTAVIENNKLYYGALSLIEKEVFCISGVVVIKQKFQIFNNIWKLFSRNPVTEIKFYL